MTMAGLTTAGRQCHPTNPPPTWYKPCRIISVYTSRKFPITKTENQITRSTGQNRTTAHVAATNPPSTSGEKSTMTPNEPYKLPIFPKLQKSIKMKKMQSKYASTTVPSPSTLTHPPQSTTNPTSTAQPHNLHDCFNNHPTSPPPIKTYLAMIPTTNNASIPSTNPKPTTMIPLKGTAHALNRYHAPPTPQPRYPDQLYPTNLSNTECCCPNNSHTYPPTTNFLPSHHPAHSAILNAIISSTTPTELPPHLSPATPPPPSDHQFDPILNSQRTSTTT